MGYILSEINESYYMTGSSVVVSGGRGDNGVMVIGGGCCGYFGDGANNQ